MHDFIQDLGCRSLVQSPRFCFCHVSSVKSPGNKAKVTTRAVTLLLVCRLSFKFNVLKIEEPVSVEFFGFWNGTVPGTLGFYLSCLLTL